MPRHQASQISNLTDKWNEWKGIGSGDSVKPQDGGKINGLTIAMEVQILSIHPLLHAEFKKGSSNDTALIDEDKDDPIQEYLESDQTDKTNDTRAVWLEKLKATENLCSDSARLFCILRLYKQSRDKHPEKKMVIFSQCLKFLGIISEAIEGEFGVKSLRYDGTVPHRLRTGIQNDFGKAHSSVPLLLTVGAGRTGLNLVSASIVIQCEVWWNGSTKWQAVRRVWRQLQKDGILSFQVFAKDGGMDQCILDAQTKKSTINGASYPTS